MPSCVNPGLQRAYLQIRSERSDEYVSTARISLVSSFLPSLFLGSIRVSGITNTLGGYNPIHFSDCLVVPFTGDNPATMVALSTPGDAVLSLGTSTTFLLAISPSDTPPARFTTSHLLAHPTTAGAHIAMLCYKNGSLAREKVRNEYANGDWACFNELVAATTPGNGGFWGLYFPLPEIIPPNVIGDFYFKSEDGLTAPTPVETL